MTIESENNEIDYSVKDQQMPKEASETPRLFKRLITLRRCSLILSFLGSLFMDVRDYYLIGRQGLLWGWALPSLIFGYWSIFAMRAKKSWARKLFIVTSFYGVGLLSFATEVKTPLTIVFFILSNMISLYCLILLFDNEVKAVFLPDSKATGAQATVNRYQVTFYLIFFFAWCLMLVGIGAYRASSSMQWVEDCVKAAQMGSASAQEALRKRATGSGEVGEKCRKVLESGYYVDHQD